MSRLIPGEVRIEQINSIQGIEFVEWHSEYLGIESKAVVRCDIDGFIWSTKVAHLLKSGSGCPQCAGNRRYTSSEYMDKINAIANGRFKFVYWPYGFSNSRSKALCRCEFDGFEWESIANNIINHGRGCPQCAGKRRWTSEEYIEMVNVAGRGRFCFSRWDGEFKNGKTKAIIKCLVDGFEWTSYISPLIRRGCGCPKCAKYGFDGSKNGTIYFLYSDCGRYVKVGISNSVSSRISILRSKTPFNFSLIGMEDSVGSKVRYLEGWFHDRYESAGLSGFDGATEWLIRTEDLIDNIRNARDLLNQDV